MDLKSELISLSKDLRLNIKSGKEIDSVNKFMSLFKGQMDWESIRRAIVVILKFYSHLLNVSGHLTHKQS
jgi:hypothetical protein